VTPTTATVRSDGDHSVGIPDAESTVTYPYDLQQVFGPAPCPEIEEERARLAAFFAPVHDGKVGVRFDFECPDCGRPQRDTGREHGRWVCDNKDCVSNQPEGDNA